MKTFDDPLDKNWLDSDYVFHLQKEWQVYDPDNYGSLPGGVENGVYIDLSLADMVKRIQLMPEPSSHMNALRSLRLGLYVRVPRFKGDPNPNPPPKKGAPVYARCPEVLELLNSKPGGWRALGTFEAAQAVKDSLQVLQYAGLSNYTKEDLLRGLFWLTRRRHVVYLPVNTPLFKQPEKGYTYNAIMEVRNLALNHFNESLDPTSPVQMLPITRVYPRNKASNSVFAKAEEMLVEDLLTILHEKKWPEDVLVSLSDPETSGGQMKMVLMAVGLLNPPDPLKPSKVNLPGPDSNYPPQKYVEVPHPYWENMKPQFKPDLGQVYVEVTDVHGKTHLAKKDPTTGVIYVQPESLGIQPLTHPYKKGDSPEKTPEQPPTVQGVLEDETGKPAPEEEYLKSLDLPMGLRQAKT